MRVFRVSVEKCMRNGKKAILNLLICMITVVLINAFAGNIASIIKQLNRLPEIMQIDVVISNLNGSINAGLDIKEKHVDAILRSQYVADPAFALSLKSGFGEFADDEYLKRLVLYSAASNNIEGISGFREEDITFVEGMDTEMFFSSTEKICLIDNAKMKQQNLSLGDDVVLTNYYYRFGKYHEIYSEPLNVDTYKIVGTTEILGYTGDGMCPDIIYPFEHIRETYHKNGFVFNAESGSFRVKDVFKLNEFKKEMHDIGFLPVTYQSEFQYDGNAITVKDETFVQSAEQLLKNRNLLLILLPFVIVSILCIGFVMAQLQMKSKVPEYAIMRSLGQSHKESFIALVMEYAITAALGSIIGLIFGMILLKTSWYVAILAAVAFFICYVIGTMAALSSLRKISIMEVLSRTE